MPKKRTILLVSDGKPEPNDSFALIRSTMAESTVVEAPSPEEALRQLASEEFDCVFCFSSSGAEESVDWLTELADRKPNISRFVVAPWISPETQLRAVFGGHFFLATPLQAQAVQAALELEDAKHTILPDARVQILISRVRSLPSRPKIYFEITRELASDNASAEHVAAIIQNDMGIASKLLQVVNSFFYGRTDVTNDIKEAVLFLGFEATASIVLSLEALSRFDKTADVHQLTDQVWAHSQTVAELSRRICQTFGLSRSACEQAYLAALLHDLGKVLLAQNFPQEYRQVRASKEVNCSPVELESKALGVTHADAGAYLLAVWGLPIGVIEAIAFHHAPPSTITEFKPWVALQLAEEVIESGRALDQVLAEYPAELGLAERAEMFSGAIPARRNAGNRRTAALATA